MRISTRGRYALRGMVDLAMNSKGKPLSIREIAERQEISTDYMEQLFHKLVKSKFLKSYRGLKGGYQLSRCPDEISVKEILETAEGPISLVDCNEIEEAKSCHRIDNCQTHKLWIHLNEMLSNHLKKITLKDVCEGKYDF